MIPLHSVNCLSVVFLKVLVKFEQRFQSSEHVLLSKFHLPCGIKTVEIKLILIINITKVENPYSHQAKVRAKTKKVKEQVKKNKE